MIKKIRVTVDGKTFDATVEIPDDPQPSSAPAPAAPAAAPAPVAAQSAPPPPPSPAAPASAGAGDIPSPLAGHIVGISATVGGAVKKGDPILSIEAMKMNTFVLAHIDGKVTAILVKVGDAVQEGQTLAQIA